MIYDERSELPPRERAPLRLGDAISTAHFRMVAMLQTIHRDDHLAPSTRGVLRNLIGRGPMTVPEIARLRPSSRQFVQRIVDELVRRGLVELRRNPAHARSRLVAITEKGSARVDAMLSRERRWLADAMTRTNADPTEVERAAVLIEAFVRAMDETLGEPGEDDAADR